MGKVRQGWGWGILWHARVGDFGVKGRSRGDLGVWGLGSGHLQDTWWWGGGTWLWAAVAVAERLLVDAPCLEERVWLQLYWDESMLVPSGLLYVYVVHQHDTPDGG